MTAERTGAADGATAPTPVRSRARRPEAPLIDGWSIAIVVLAALQPFASFLAGNALKLTHPTQVVTDALAWTALSVVAFVGVRLLTRAAAPLTIAAAFAAFGLSFWNFGRWLPYEPSSAVTRWVAIAIWALVTAVVVRLAMRLAVAWSSARTFLVLLLGVWTVGSLLLYVAARPATTSGDRPDAYAGPAFAPFTERPNVYWLLLDEHARADQVRRWTGVDTSWFADELEARGFATSASSHSGYLFTHLSTSSTLAMEYAYTPGHDYRSEYPLAVPAIAGDNPVVETFEANGYRYVFAPDGSVEWAGCAATTGDRVCVDPVGGPFALAEPRTNLVRATPIGSLGLPLVHNDLTSVLDGVEQIRSEDPERPLFTFAHVLSPHYPFRYEADCSLRATWEEGTQFTGEQRAAAYGNEVDCLDHDVIDAVDRITAEDPDAIVVVQSDHGSSLTFNWQTPFDQWSSANFTERFGVVNAMRLPERCRDQPIEGQPLVNTFRIVLGCLSGTEPDLLPTRLFYSGYGKISDLVEVPVEQLDDP